MKMQTLKTSRNGTSRKVRPNGFSLIEIVIGSAVLLTVLLGLTGLLTLAVRGALTNTSKIQATFLAEEGIEAVRVLRDNSWSANIATQTSPFYLEFDANTWKATSTNKFIGGTFERKVTLAGVYRDGAQHIVSSGGTLDNNAKKVTVSVSWLLGKATTTKSLSTILTDIFKN